AEEEGRGVHVDQAADVVFEARLDHMFCPDHVALVEIPIAPPGRGEGAAVKHHLLPRTGRHHRLRILQPAPHKADPLPLQRRTDGLIPAENGHLPSRPLQPPGQGLSEKSRSSGDQCPCHPLLLPIRYRVWSAPAAGSAAEGLSCTEKAGKSPAPGPAADPAGQRSHPDAWRGSSATYGVSPASTRTAVPGSPASLSRRDRETQRQRDFPPSPPPGMRP